MKYFIILTFLSIQLCFSQTLIITIEDDVEAQTIDRLKYSGNCDFEYSVLPNNFNNFLSFGHKINTELDKPSGEYTGLIIGDKKVLTVNKYQNNNGLLEFKNEGFKSSKLKKIGSFTFQTKEEFKRVFLHQAEIQNLNNDEEESFVFLPRKELEISNNNYSPKDNNNLKTQVKDLLTLGERKSIELDGGIYNITRTTLGLKDFRREIRDQIVEANRLNLDKNEVSQNLQMLKVSKSLLEDRFTPTVLNKNVNYNGHIAYIRVIINFN